MIIDTTIDEKTFAEHLAKHGEGVGGFIQDKLSPYYIMKIAAFVASW